MKIILKGRLLRFRRCRKMPSWSFPYLTISSNFWGIHMPSFPLWVDLHPKRRIQIILSQISSLRAFYGPKRDRPLIPIKTNSIRNFLLFYQDITIYNIILFQVYNIYNDYIYIYSKMITTSQQSSLCIVIFVCM